MIMSYFDRYIVCTEVVLCSQVHQIISICYKVEYFKFDSASMGNKLEQHTQIHIHGAWISEH